MTKFTAKENKIRKSVFDYNRKHVLDGSYLYRDSPTKKYGKGKVVREAIIESNLRIKAGNCIPGTNAFIENHNLQKTDSRSGAFLLRIAKGTWNLDNVVKMIKKYMDDTYPEFMGGSLNSIVFTSYLKTL